MSVRPNSRLLLCLLSLALLTGCAGAEPVNAVTAETAENAATPEAAPTPSPTPAPTPSGSHLIADFPLLLQMPELPTGCEVTALTMVLQYYGFDADKVEMAADYLPTAPADFSTGEDGLTYGPDLEQYFVGDPFGSGYICGTAPIVAAADGYLADQGSGLRAEDLTGAEPEDLYVLVDQDVPVVVWVTISMEERLPTDGWYTTDGDYVEWSSNDHGAVLIGYDAETVIIADPLAGQIEYPRASFEAVFASRGNQCVILQ
ncbi:MAG TPA: C39 family peptidase [Candidatus Gemmiger faecigallinarum]|nr:C39 family peptidase [Candidatus Gemmiger faecigallinarum]